MGKITVTPAPIEGLYIIEPQVFGDSRGYFMETYSKRDMEQAGLYFDFVQDSHSKSRRGVLRGLHFQKQHPQGKMVRAIQGRLYDVAVDLRASSPSFGQWFGVELSEENHKQLLIAPGFAHGFLALSETVQVCYKSTDLYCPGDEGGLAWNDPTLGIEWPELVGSYQGSPSAQGYSLEGGAELILSEKDQHWPGLDSCFRFE